MSQERRRKQQARMLQHAIEQGRKQSELQRMFTPKAIVSAVRGTFK